MNKKINTDSFDFFFTIVSKLVILFPLLILIIALIFRFNQTTNKIKTTKNQNVFITPTIFVSKKLIDLTGSYYCLFEDKGQKYEAFIDNKKISLVATVNNQTKEYDLSPYYQTIQKLINNNPEMIESAAKNYVGVDISLNDFEKYCKKK